MDLCSHCHKDIKNVTMAKVGHFSFHEECLLCSTCNSALSTTCFALHGRLYCREDFIQLSVPRCAGCGDVFTKEDEVRRMEGENYHLACFQCQLCSLTLEKGMNVGRGREGGVLCEEHFLQMEALQIHVVLF